MTYKGYTIEQTKDGYVVLGEDSDLGFYKTLAHAKRAIDTEDF